MRYCRRKALRFSCRRFESARATGHQARAGITNRHAGIYIDSATRRVNLVSNPCDSMLVHRLVAIVYWQQATFRCRVNSSNHYRLVTR